MEGTRPERGQPDARLSPRKCRVLAASPLALLASALFFAAQAAPPPLPRTTFGNVGLVDMPSARMAPDGELSFSASFFEKTQRYALGFQMFPWLEAQFRYAGLTHFNPDYPVYFDRSFALKARLWNEDGAIPAVAVGINDLVGTGIYGGEYVVASKQFGSVDASVGMGWGRMGTANSIRNPLGAVSSSFYTRSGFEGQGGDFNLKQYFHGPRSGIFGGLTWRTPLEGLTAIAEYSSDAYSLESQRGSFRPKNQVNLGLSYAGINGVTLGVNWLYGKAVGLNLLLHMDPTTESYPQKIGEVAPSVPALRSVEEQQAALQGLATGVVAPAARPTAGRQDRLVELLWRDDVQNVDIRGTTLALTVSGPATAARCQAAAAQIQSSGADFTTAEIRAASGGPAQSCRTGAALRVAALTGPSITTTLTDARPALLTINAALPDSSTAARTRAQALAAIKAEAKKQSLRLEAADFAGSTAVLYYNNTYYRSEVDAINRLTAILMKEAPPEIERFRLINVRTGIVQREQEILRSPQERQYLADNRVNVFGNGSEAQSRAAPMYTPILDAQDRKRYPTFSWSVFPQFRQELFDPDNPFAVQFVMAASGVVQLFRGFSLEAVLETNLYDNFNVSRTAGTALPPVRTDFLKYLIKGKNGIADLSANYRFRLAPDVYAIGRAGYLESMFAGAGGEILWRPENARWALGVDMYRVWQRDFDRLFGLQRYKTFTGHVSLYYASPWHDLNFALRAGQYLAGDRGVTVEVTRRFATGIEVGAFFTRTNVSAQQFGEGSFDKGIIIRIPLGWMLPIETQGQYALDMRPIQRDGGQRLMADTVLYEETRRASQAEIYTQTAGAW